MLENNQTKSSVTFGKFGKTFQERFVQAILTDQKFAEQTMEVFKSEYLELKYLSFLTDRYYAYSNKYKVFPTLQMLVTIIKEDLKVGTDVILRDQIIDYLTRMRTNEGASDMPYVKEKSLEFARKQALKKALESAVDQMEANKYESIVETIKNAVQVGTAPSVGHDFFKDMDARFTMEVAVRGNCSVSPRRAVQENAVYVILTSMSNTHQSESMENLINHGTELTLQEEQSSQETSSFQMGLQ